MGATAEQHDAVLDTEEGVLRVRRDSNPQALGSAIAHALFSARKVTVRAIGAGAVNQAIKGCAIARTYCAGQALDMSIKPGFVTVSMPNTVTGEPEDVSAIILVCVVT